MDRPIDPLEKDPPKPPKKWSWAVWTPDADVPPDFRDTARSDGRGGR